MRAQESYTEGYKLLTSKIIGYTHCIMIIKLSQLMCGCIHLQSTPQTTMTWQQSQLLIQMASKPVRNSVFSPAILPRANQSAMTLRTQISL